MQEPDRLVRIKYQGAVPSWIDNIFQDIPDRALSGEFYEAIGFDEPGKSFIIGDKDIQVQFYNATRYNWATFHHISIYFFHLNDKKGYDKIWQIFPFNPKEINIIEGQSPKEKDFTQTVIGFITEPFEVDLQHRLSLKAKTHIDYHEISLVDIQQLESIIQNIIRRSLNLGHLMKICCLGDPKKTVIIRHYAENKFDKNYLPTLGVDVTTKHTNFHGLQVKLIFADTAGQKFFGKLRPRYYRGASSGILFFNASKKTPLFQIKEWLEEFHRIAVDAPVALVGLLTNEESYEENLVQTFTKEHVMSFTLMKIHETEPISIICEELIKIRFTRRNVNPKL